MKKVGKGVVVEKRKNSVQQESAKTEQSPRIVTGPEIPNLLKNRPFKIRFY